ncbi:MAG: site-specific integrase [Acidobacteriota bacterium]
MFARYFWRQQVDQYRASRHKARIDHVAGSLVAQRYLDDVVADHLREWLRLTTYFDTKGVPLPSGVRASAVQDYIAQRPGGRSAPRLRFVRASARLFLETDAAGHCRRRIGGAPAHPMSAWLAPIADAYRVFLGHHRGLAVRTVHKRMWHLAQFAAFVDQVGVRTLAGLQAAHIQQFLTQFHRHAPATRLTTGVSLRSFLRWAYQESLLPTDLRVAVIAGRHSRHAGLRDVLSEEEITDLVMAVDRSSAIGRRDYAVLLLAARYGMRPSDIRRLQVDQVQWRAGVIAIRQAKTGGPLTLPLLQDVRDALIAYLRNGRPPTHAREIFIRHRAPFEPFVAANNLSTIMRTALRRVGLAQRPGRRGLYLFRHTLATRLLAAECPIKTIGDVLGHVSTDTTMEYANVDLQALRKVSLSEAEVQS